MTRRLKARATGAPSLLRSYAVVEAEQAQRLQAFRDWFEKLPGAEWEYGSTDSQLIYCYWTHDPNHSEWPKVFCAYRLEWPLETLIAEVRDKDFSPPFEWDHWKFFGLEKTTDRARIVARFHAAMPSDSDAKAQRWFRVAYHRCLNDCYYASVSDVRHSKR